MIKLILTLVFFCILASAIKPVPSVKELTEVNKTYCKDVCK
jgi:hypothetical protein